MPAALAAAVVNYQTPDLLGDAVRSFKEHYPDVPLLIVDNGSEDGSPALVGRLARELPATEALRLEENIFHGPAMHRALTHLGAGHVYVFDSDTVTRRGGFLEEMQALLTASPTAYAAGQIVRVNRRGFRADDGVPVPASAYMLLDRARYLTLPPFIHHGLPVLENMTAAHARGLTLESFPVESYVDHLGRGTAARYGYGLGLRSRLDYLLNRLGW